MFSYHSDGILRWNGGEEGGDVIGCNNLILFQSDILYCPHKFLSVFKMVRRFVYQRGQNIGSKFSRFIRHRSYAVDNGLHRYGVRLMDLWETIKSWNTGLGGRNKPLFSLIFYDPF